MANQNILSFYGSKLDLKVDYSELYDFELTNVQDDFDSQVLDFTTPISYTGLTIDSSCLTGVTTPYFEVNVNEPYTGGTCDFTVRRRTEKGWTLDYVFSGTVSGSTFYYLGIKDDLTDPNYADNNLTFSFTSDNRIKWTAYHYSGYCNPDTGYTETYYTASGQTEPLCSNGISEDFNITIVFDRYKHYFDCDVENQGGFNDLIQGPHAVPYTNTGVTAVTSTQIVSGYTTINDYKDWITGGTLTHDYSEYLNKKWAFERDRRLGTLKIYLNGNPIYKVENFEEVIPSLRQSTNPMIQKWGDDSINYYIKKFQYFEEPLDFIHVKHHFITEINSNYNVVQCFTPCIDNIQLLRSIYITPTPSITPTNSPTPSITPSNTHTPTNTPTPTITPTASNCYRYTFITGGTPNQSQFYVDSTTLQINKKDYYNRQYRFSGLTQGNGISFGDLNSYATYATFTIDSTPPIEDINYWTFSGNLNNTIGVGNYNVCFLTVTPTPTPSYTPTLTPTITPTHTPTKSLTPTPSVTLSNTPTITPTNTLTPTPTTSVSLYKELIVGIGNSYSESCDNYTNSSFQSLYATKVISSIVVGDTIYYDTDGNLYSGYFSYGSNWYYVSLGIVITIQSCSVVPTTPPNIITPPPSGFTFDADYIIVTYSFTDGLDLDTRTRISNPGVGMSEYIGWANLSTYPTSDTVQPILTWGDDNTGTGFEAVLIDLKQFKIQYPSETSIIIDMNAMWYNQVGNNPVIMDIIMYKGGFIVPDINNYSFSAINATGKYGVASTGTVISLNSQSPSDLEHVTSLQYNLLTYRGQFI
jgi:hypothetical protein